MYNSEKEFQSDVMKDLRNSGRWYKIPDVSMQLKPFDIIGLVDKVSYAIELKFSRLKKGVTYEQAFQMLRPNQVGALEAFQDAGGLSFIYVYNQPEDKIYEYEFRLLDGIYSEL